MKKWKKIFEQGPVLTHSEAEMVALGRRMADELEAGDALGLVGDLGAGKTHLIQGLLEGLGCSDPAASPTFSLVHEHESGRLRAAHFDFYRMRSPEEAFGIGWDEYADGDAVLLVEWADRFDGALMPPRTLWLVLRHEGPSERSVMLAGD